MTYKLVYLARRAQSVSREDWPRTWKSHAVFASQFPVLEAGIEGLRYCNRINGADLAGVSNEHDGVAVAWASRLEALDGTGFTADDRARIDEDELRVFDQLTPNFTWYCTEQLIVDGPAAEVAVFRFLQCREEVSSADFDAQLVEVHVAATRPQGLNRLALNHPLNARLPLFPFDAIAESWFENETDAVNALAGDALTQDLADICALDKSVTMLTRTCHRWPKA